MDDDDVARRSAALGLDKLATDHRTDLVKALKNGATLAEKLPTDLHWSEEPGHTFGLPTRLKTTS